MTDAVSEFAPRRLPHVQDLSALETEIAQHRRATEQSTYQSDMRPGGMLEGNAPAPRDVLSDIALLVASLPLRAAMQMAEAVVTLQDYKPPQTKIELAMLLNAWAEARLEPPPK